MVVVNREAELLLARGSERSIFQWYDRYSVTDSLKEAMMEMWQGLL